MKNRIKAVLLVAAIAMTPVFAGAATVSGTIEEGGPSGDYNGLVADHTYNDFNDGTGNPLLNVGGDFKLWGSVTHVSDTQYEDGWTMDFGTGAYKLDLDWQNVLSTPLDFKLVVQSMGGTNTFFLSSLSTALTGSGSLSVDGDALFSGKWAFSINPIFGQNAAVETMNWQLTGTDMTPVPLPASALLLLAGLGGLVVVRRKGVPS